MASVAHTKHKALPWRRNAIHLCISINEKGREEQVGEGERGRVCL